ncbi:MAG TPA: hypothetical protein VG269_18180 [Tepidisphaeraceae bacterium]|jgi:HTH-type transcriptional regulator/antitoxin HigA|nr:hypothetical protein [Tepidisphaeraceae bacterium]
MIKAAGKLKSSRAPVAEDYLDLVRNFPLRPLSSKAELVAAGQILDRYVGRQDLTPGERDYVAALVRFVEDYEHQRALFDMKNLGPIEILKHLMEENHMSTSELGHVLGSRGVASEVLNGNRGLSKAHIGKLAARFHVEPGLFLDVTPADNEDRRRGNR